MFLGETAQGSAVSAAPSAHACERVSLAVRLLRDPFGPEIAREALTARDLPDAVGELWFEAYLRRGRPDMALASVRARIEPVFAGNSAKAAGRCAGFELVATGDAGDEFRCAFAHHSLGPVAARGARRLRASGELAQNAVYYFDLVWTAPRGETAPVWIAGPEGRGAPELLRQPLARWLADGERVPFGAEQGDYPVLFTRRALARAERIARKGAAERPAVESGGLLIGVLCQCPDTDEIYAVVLDVLEATDSEASTYAIEFSGKTWARFEAILRARRRNPAMRHHLILGQVHGHNFLPFDGAKPCAACALRAVCTRTSATLSEEDRTWCRSVFSAEPWQLSMIFGHDAVGRPVSAFYGQAGGVLVRRDFWVVDSTDDLFEGR